MDDNDDYDDDYDDDDMMTVMMTTAIKPPTLKYIVFSPIWHWAPSRPMFLIIFDFRGFLIFIRQQWLASI